MKITNKNLNKFISLLLLFGVIGTLCWELIELIVNTAGLQLNLSAGPVGFDIEVLSLYIKFNPGTILGTAAGWLVFRKI